MDGKKLTFSDFKNFCRFMLVRLIGVPKKFFSKIIKNAAKTFLKSLFFIKLFFLHSKKMRFLKKIEIWLAKRFQIWIQSPQVFFNFEKIFFCYLYANSKN